MPQFNRKQLAMDIVKTAYRYDVDIMIKVNNNELISARDLPLLIQYLASSESLRLKMFVKEQELEALYLSDLRGSFDTLFKVYGIYCSLYF